MIIVAVTLSVLCSPFEWLVCDHVSDRRPVSYLMPHFKLLGFSHLAKLGNTPVSEGETEWFLDRGCLELVVATRRYKSCQTESTHRSSVSSTQRTKCLSQFSDAREILVPQWIRKLPRVGTLVAVVRAQESNNLIDPKRSRRPCQWRKTLHSAQHMVCTRKRYRAAHSLQTVLIVSNLLVDGRTRCADRVFRSANMALSNNSSGKPWAILAGRRSRCPHRIGREAAFHTNADPLGSF